MRTPRRAATVAALLTLFLTAFGASALATTSAAAEGLVGAAPSATPETTPETTPAAESAAPSPDATPTPDAPGAGHDGTATADPVAPAPSPTPAPLSASTAAATSAPSPQPGALALPSTRTQAAPLAALPSAPVRPAAGPTSGPNLQCGFHPGGLVITLGNRQAMNRLEVWHVNYPPTTGDGTVAAQGQCNGSDGDILTDGEFDDYTGADLNLSCDAYDWTAAGTSCTASTPAGYWNIHYEDSATENTSDYFFRVPDAPVFTSATQTSPGTDTATGTGATPGDSIQVLDDDDNLMCTALVQTGGAWSCTLDEPTASGTGLWAVAIDAASGAMSDYSAPVTADYDDQPEITCAFKPGKIDLGVTDSAPAAGIVSLFGPYTVPGTYTPTTDGTCNGHVSMTGFTVEPIFSGSIVDCLDSSATASLHLGPVRATADPAGWDAACNNFTLSPGVYGLEYSNEDDSRVWTYYFTVPATPAGITPRVSGRNITLQGGGDADGDTITVLDGTTVLCTTTVNAGQWSCTFPESSATSVTVTETDATTGAVSPRSAAISIPATPVPPAPAPTETPQIALAGLPPFDWALDWSGVPLSAHGGDGFTIGSAGLPTGTEVQVWLHSTPVELLDTTVTGDGPLAVTIPTDTEPGDHMLEVDAVTPDGQSHSGTHPITVVAAPTPTPTPAPASDRNQPGTLSMLTTAVPGLSAVIDNPVCLALAAALALVLLFLVALPTELLNDTIKENAGRISRAFAAVGKAASRATAWFLALTRFRAIAAAIIILVVSIIFGFVDPQFGFDLVSVREVLALAIALFVVNYCARWIAGLILNRGFKASTAIVIQPWVAIAAVVGVVIARLLDFAPGFLVGIAVGLELFHATRKLAARSVAIQFGIVIALALIAWLVYSALPEAEGEPTFGGDLLRETLAAITTEGLTGAVLGLLPLSFVDGRELWEGSKRLWAVMFLIAAVAFALIVLPTAQHGTGVADALVWTIVLVAYAIVVLALWLVFRTIAARNKHSHTTRQNEEI